MNRFPGTRVVFSLALLWLAATALVSSLRTSILGLNNAPFLPLAILGMGIAYLLGFGKGSERRSWAFILAFSPFLILLEASNTWHALWQIVIHLPSLEVSTLFAFLTRQRLDLSFFQIQVDEILTHLEVFFQAVLPPGSKDSTLIMLQIFWDIPLYLACAWSGWWSSRRNSILIALVPSLAMQVFLLNFARRQHGLTLQIGVFILIFLMSFHQKWSLSKSESKTQSKVRMETYARMFILSSVLAIAAGWAPILPVPEKPIPTATKTPTPQQDTPNETIETPTVESDPSSPSAVLPGLPRDLLIDSPPQNSMNVIFLANTGEIPLSDKGQPAVPPVAQTYYWRWITYDLYNGSAWSSSPTTSAAYSADQPLMEYSAVDYRVVHQSIIKASVQDDHVYWTGSLMRADQPMDTTWRTVPPGEDPLLHMDMLGSQTDAQQYSADSLLPQFNETQLREATQVYPTEILQKYLDLPNGAISQRVRDLAVTLTYQAQNPYGKAKAIEAYLRTFPYTLDVPTVPADREISDYFLFEIKKGYCEYYATAMVVLARTVGLPARMVIGYAGNEYDPHTAQYIVREANSHSWVEIYFPDLGWVEFEPTASQPLHTQLAPVEELNVQAPVTPTHNDRSGIIYQKHGYFVPRSLTFIIFLSVLVLIGICFFYLRTQGLWFSYKTIGSIYQYIYRHGRKIDPGAPPNATPSLFAEKLKAKLNIDHRFARPAADELDQLTSLYLKETYSPHPVTSLEQEHAVQIWHTLFWRLLYIRMILRLPISLREALLTTRTTKW